MSETSPGNIKRIALWAVPRSVSTAFERVFIERGDAHVIHEPFSLCYYYGPERPNDRFADTPPNPDYSYAKTAKRILASDSEGIVFFKDMASHAEPLGDENFFDALTNTFIIRNPREAIASFYRKWPDFTPEEAGYGPLRRLFDDVAAKHPGRTPPLVDATDFRSDPHGVMRLYCDAVGIPFDEAAMTWEQRKVKRWGSWQGWHDDAQNSTGIKPPDNNSDVELPPHVEAVVRECMSDYEYLYGHRLEP